MLIDPIHYPPSPSNGSENGVLLCLSDMASLLILLRRDKLPSNPNDVIVVVEEEEEEESRKMEAKSRGKTEAALFPDGRN